MAAKAAKRAPRKKGGYQMPEAIPLGEVLTDISKKQWILGKSIGVGGFGEVYSAASYSGNIPKDYPNVIKIEPHGNGPLFVEMHFYMRNCKPNEIDSWRRKKKLAALGMPKYVASGSHEYKNTKYRFLVIDRYGTDLWKIFEANNRQFPEHTVYKLALQIIDILEYIHHKTYVHADIKGENLLLDLKTFDQVYLVDFGLASHCTTSTELKVDPKKAHNGTLQYTSRDAHMGVPTQRGDIEILCYNMILWLCGSLPWEKLVDKVIVQKEKEKAFENIDSFLNKCFHGSTPQAMQKCMTLLSNMKFNETPCYEKFKDTLIAGLKKLNHKPDGKLGLKTTPAQQNSVKSTPQKVRKLDQVRQSPRSKHVAAPSNSLRNNQRESTIGIVIDKKRGNKKDIKKVLEDIDPDGEYDIKIVQKTKKSESDDEVPEATKKATLLSSRKKMRVNYVDDDSENDSMEPLMKRPNKMRQKKPATSKTRRKVISLDDSTTVSEPEPEIVSKGTRSRPATTVGRKVTAKKNMLQFNKPTLFETESEEDIFDM
ncbi:PREDICTED: serine/threonine-protein kinase VRK1-like [Dinoponera quadriceps]|uniref:non-specific serine/threonine protein kinase n=1 Tax=Dinoponera quadriceps TaxID=609295 RepID=A0A6P3XR47_DINQU|nr:PREDICTED: serine/threonine-protein kinase VRK1-like [Dinoponera quadriceps]